MFLFLLFFVELFILFLLSRTLTRSLSYLLHYLTRSKKATIHIMAWLFFPGTVLHELSHAISAGVMGVRVGTMEFVPTIDGDRVKLGSVQVEQTDFFRRFLIGAAPFFVGTTILLCILFYATQNNLYQNPWIVLLIGYVVFEIGNTMFSSKKDMEGAVELLATIVVLVIVFYFLGVRLPSFNPDIIFENPVVRDVLQKGSLFLLVPIVIDIVIIGLLKFIKR
jgi:hypothetical protein